MSHLAILAMVEKKTILIVDSLFEFVDKNKGALEVFDKIGNLYIKLGRK